MIIACLHGSKHAFIKKILRLSSRLRTAATTDISLNVTESEDELAKSQQVEALDVEASPAEDEADIIL